MLHVSDKIENTKEKLKERKKENFELFYFIILINKIK